MTIPDMTKKNLQALVCVSIASPRVHYTKLLQQKSCTKNLLQNLYEQNCLLPSLTQLPNVPNKAITSNPVQFKAVASNGLDMAQSVEL